MNVYFVRHGESVNNTMRLGCADDEEFHHHRQPDAMLTDRGTEQIKLLAHRVATSFESPTEIWCSFLHRALFTAEAIRSSVVATGRSVKVRVFQDIAEVGGYYFYSEEEGKKVGRPGPTSDDIRREFPDFDEVDERAAKGWWAGNPNQETEEEARNRAKRLVARLITMLWNQQRRNEGGSNRKENIVIVTHADFFACVWDELCPLLEKGDGSTLAPAVVSSSDEQRKTLNTCVTHFHMRVKEEGNAEEDGHEGAVVATLLLNRDVSHLAGMGDIL